MRSTSLYRPCAVLVKAALISDQRRCFSGVVVENDHGMVILSGIVDEPDLVREAGAVAEEASGRLVVNHVVVSEVRH